MFHRTSDASKVALVDLCRRLDDAGASWLDGQLPTRHLRSMGAESWPRSLFLRRLASVRDVEVRPVTPQLARELDAPDTRGVVVWQLHRESTASRAGIEPGDIIVSFDGEPIEDAAHYGRLLLDAEVGRRVTLGLLRYGDALDVDVEVERAQRRQ